MKLKVFFSAAIFTLCAGIILMGCGILSQSSANKKLIEPNSIPYFTAQWIYVTDNNGKKLLNKDGTPQMRVLLVDQFGNYRSKESVKAQHTAIRNAIAQIGVNVFWGFKGGYDETTRIGDEKGRKVSAWDKIAVGIFTGWIALKDSKKEKELIDKHKKSLDEQEKLLEAYSETFTVEGIPVKADIDLSNINGLDFSKSEPLSMTAEQVKKEIESEGFNSTDTSAWDF